MLREKVVRMTRSWSNILAYFLKKRNSRSGYDLKEKEIIDSNRKKSVELSKTMSAVKIDDMDLCAYVIEKQFLSTNH